MTKIGGYSIHSGILSQWSDRSMGVVVVTCGFSDSMSTRILDSLNVVHLCGVYIQEKLTAVVYCSLAWTMGVETVDAVLRSSIFYKGHRYVWNKCGKDGWHDPRSWGQSPKLYLSCYTDPAHMPAQLLIYSVDLGMNDISQHLFTINWMFLLWWCRWSFWHILI